MDSVMIFAGWWSRHWDWTPQHIRQFYNDFTLRRSILRSMNVWAVGQDPRLVCTRTWNIYPNLIGLKNQIHLRSKEPQSALVTVSQEVNNSKKKKENLDSMDLILTSVIFRFWPLSSMLWNFYFIWFIKRVKEIKT